MIQARAAADAVERFPLAAIGQQLGAAVIQQHHVELFGPVDFARAARPRQERRVNRQRLAGGAASQQLQKYGQILRARNQLLDSRHRDVNLRRGSGQARVALVFDESHRAGIGDQEIGAADADVGGQEFLPQHAARDQRLLLDHRLVGHAQGAREQIAHVVAGQVQGRRDNMIRTLVRELQDVFAQIGLHRFQIDGAPAAR